MRGLKPYMTEDPVNSPYTRPRNILAAYASALKDPNYRPGAFDQSAALRAARNPNVDMDEDMLLASAYETGKLDTSDPRARMWGNRAGVNIYENPVEAAREAAAKVMPQPAASRPISRPAMAAPVGVLAPLDDTTDVAGPMPTGYQSALSKVEDIDEEDDSEGGE